MRLRCPFRGRCGADRDHLHGPGLNRRTSVKGTGSMTWLVRLRVGTYSFWSEANPKVKGRFTVVAA
jgi:hypothetical protein